jgi:hypothetical protein
MSARRSFIIIVDRILVRVEVSSSSVGACLESERHHRRSVPVSNRGVIIVGRFLSRIGA